MPVERIRASEFMKTPGEQCGQGLLALSPGPVPWQDYEDNNGVHYRIFPGLAAQIWDHQTGRYRVAVRTETLERHLSFSQYLLVFGLIALLCFRLEQRPGQPNALQPVSGHPSPDEPKSHPGHLQSPYIPFGRPGLLPG